MVLAGDIGVGCDPQYVDSISISMTAPVAKLLLGTSISMMALVITDGKKKDEL